MLWPYVWYPPAMDVHQAWRRASFIGKPNADGSPVPPPADVWKPREGHWGERKLEWIPSAIDRAPLRKILARKLRWIFGSQKAPRNET